ncbi:MAG: hypothetical protein FJZ83_02165, partial [Chloroflexi bacterium]|nr:hypothetical protein [Chloroflexota bacterium]
MKQFGIACSIFILMWVIGLVATPVFALSERSTVSPLSSSDQASSEEEIVLDCKYPVISSYAGSYFSWDINLSYKGGKAPKLFDLKVTVPEGFLYTK